MSRWRPVLIGLLALAAGAAAAVHGRVGAAVPRARAAAEVGLALAPPAPAPATAPATAVRADAPREPRPGGGVPGLARAFAGGRVVTGATPHRLVLFTFDDGPDVRHTPRLLDALDRERVRALFFLTARRMEGRSQRERAQAAVAREIVRRGHVVGSHTLDHLQLPTLNNAAVLEQVREAERIFERTFGARPWLLRPPGGARSDRVDRLIAERGYTQVLWNLGAGDVQVETPEQVLATWRRVFDRREREDGDGGGIVLLHDIHERSVEAFSLILADLRARNCRLLRRGEELYDVVDDLAPFFEPRAPGDAPGLAAGPALPDTAWIAARQARLRAEAADACQRGARVASSR